jgi:hypothetical protein
MFPNSGTAISPIHLSLSAEERELIAELLERERVSLPVEIHHTRTGKFRSELRERLEIVDALLRRLHTN